MKKLVITLAALLTAYISFADTIDRQQAQTIAQRWLDSEVTEVSFGSDAFYIFNGKCGGWIIISAEDAAAPVLGYNDTGSFNSERMPSNFRHWIQGYEKDLHKARAEKLKPSTEVKALWKTAGYRTKAAAEKVLGTPIWGQDSPFNDQCPTVTENGKTYTAISGCVATAMAEILWYHKWPEHGTGTIGGYTYTSEFKQKVSIPSYSIDSHTYDYSLMPYEYKGSENSAQRNAVAQLVHDCGVMVEAMYNHGGGGTGAYSEDIVKALSEHMYYSSSAQLIYRYAFDDADWTRMIEKEIDEGRPILYGGIDDEGGHQFVCDGYDTKDYIHINWGWDGDHNGFFTLTLKIPGLYTFSDNQSMIVNLAPDSEGDDIQMAGPIVYDCADSNSKGLYLQSGTVLSKNFKLGINALSNINYYVDYTGAFKAALVNWKGDVKEYISDEVSLKLDGYNIVVYTDIECTIKGDVTFGDRVVLFYKTSAGNWELINGYSAYDYSKDPNNPTLRYLASSVPAVDAAYILIPEELKAGDTYFFEIIPGYSPVKQFTWYYDGVKQDGITANLTSGAHTISASVTFNSGDKENLTASIIVK